MRYQWHFEVVWENFPIMLSGIGLTIALSILSMLAGAILGMVVALARLSPWTWLRGLAYCYTELFRTTPLLVQIVWVFYVLPLLTLVSAIGVTELMYQARFLAVDTYGRWKSLPSAP